MFQNLLDTYDKCSAIIGVSRFNEDGSVNERKTLLPIGHTTQKSEICITIDKDGNFIDVNRDNKEITIIIPCTEKSAGRSSGIAPHPLCDQIDYVSGINDEKYNAYLNQLNSWKDSVAELNAIHAYVSRKTITDDLQSHNMFNEGEYIVGTNGDKQLDYEKIRKIGIRFTVKMKDKTINVWEDPALSEIWINYILQNENGKTGSFDYLSGIPVDIVASQHPKNINPITGNAKIISCNDNSEFTYRGRFAKQDDAILVDYKQSQKMHQMLRWLISNYGYAVDTQVIFSWRVDVDTETEAKMQNNSFDLFNDMQKTFTNVEAFLDVDNLIYANYAVKLKNLLQGYGNTSSLKSHNCKICIAILDSTSTGRIAPVFYQELEEDDYIENIVKWHENTSYFLTTWIKSKDEKDKIINKPIHYIGAPSYDDVLYAIYGKPHGDAYYNVLKKKIRKQLVECMFGNFSFPKNLVEMAANRASSPMSFTDSNNSFSKMEWERAVNITCALTRKYYKEKKEEIKLELEENRRDRDYLFGRLLSVADRIEGTALYKADKQNTRPTNALKLMNAFQVKPFSTWGQLYNQLIPYRNQLNGAGYYQSIIDSIMALFEEGDYENNSPLSPLYLLCYSLQNKFFMNKTSITETEEIENDDINK